VTVIGFLLPRRLGPDRAECNPGSRSRKPARVTVRLI
jgi:hypothetical protein